MVFDKRTTILSFSLWVVLAAAMPSLRSDVTLFPRQSTIPINDIDPKCTTPCDALQTSFAAVNTSDPSAVCTDSIATQLEQCLSCEVSAQKVDQASVTGLVDEYQDQCAAANHAVKVPSAAGRRAGLGAGPVVGVVLAATVVALVG